MFVCLIFFSSGGLYKWLFTVDLLSHVDLRLLEIHSLKNTPHYRNISHYNCHFLVMILILSLIICEQNT